MRARTTRRQVGIGFASCAVASIIAWAVACSRELEITGGDSDPTVDAVADGAAATDALPPPIDIDANLADCGIAARPDRSDAIHVTPDGATTGTCGAFDAPCSLARALEIARDDGKPSTVFVSVGNYDADLVLSPDLRIEGGWRALPTGWTPICDQRVVAVSGATYATVRAIDTPNVTLALLTIRGTRAGIASGETRFGVFARGPTTTLTLESVAIVAGGGGQGLSGNGGQTGGGAQAAPCPPSDGGDGMVGSVGPAGTLSIAPDGGISATGSAGGMGAQGRAGTDGGTGTPTLGGQCFFMGASTCGFGGTCQQPNPGRSGCGGGGGVGGGPAGVGGGSFGVFASDNARVTFKGGACGSSAAGAGGQGGAGGPGAPGSPGQAGTTLNNVLCALSTGDCEPVPSCTVTRTVTVLGGTAGGAGGKGGAGGQGAGGMGGPSFGVVEINGGIVDTTSAEVSFGAAGATGAPNGAPGKAAARGP